MNMIRKQYMVHNHSILLIKTGYCINVKSLIFVHVLKFNVTRIRGAFSIFCLFAFKARSTTLIFVECTSITFHKTRLLDDVHKVLAVFTGHKLCFGMFFSIFLIYRNTADLVIH